MPTYISLIKFTHQGISTIKEGPNRLGASKEILNRYGSKLKAFYLTMGRYDIVTISEAPDDAVAAKIALTIGSAGNVTTETLRAFIKTNTARSLRLCPDAATDHSPVTAGDFARHRHSNSRRHADCVNMIGPSPSDATRSEGEARDEPGAAAPGMWTASPIHQHRSTANCIALRSPNGFR